MSDLRTRTCLALTLGGLLWGSAGGAAEGGGAGPSAGTPGPSVAPVPFRDPWAGDSPSRPSVPASVGAPFGDPWGAGGQAPGPAGAQVPGAPPFPFSQGAPAFGPRGMPGADPLAVFQALDLSEEQRDRLARLSEDLRKRQWEVQGKVMDRESELRRLGEEQRKAVKALQDLQGQLGQVVADAMKRASDVLTEEQRQRLQGGPAGMGVPAMPPGGVGMPPAGYPGVAPGGGYPQGMPPGMPQGMTPGTSPGMTPGMPQGMPSAMPQGGAQAPQRTPQMGAPFAPPPGSMGPGSGASRRAGSGSGGGMGSR